MLASASMRTAFVAEWKLVQRCGGGEYVIPHERPPECLFEYWGAIFAVLCVPLRNLCHQGVGGHWKCSIKRLEVAPPLLHNVRSSVPGTSTDGLDTLVIDSAAMYILILIISI